VTWFALRTGEIDSLPADRLRNKAQSSVTFRLQGDFRTIARLDPEQSRIIEAAIVRPAHRC
jgi:hypothetical protein